MARIIDAKYSTIAGTPSQIRAFIDAMTAGGAGVVDLKFSNFVVLDRAVTDEQLRMALATTPAPQKGRRT